MWAAIATGPGISAWFVPAQVDGREGGEIRREIRPGFPQPGVVTAWEPPERLAYDEDHESPETGRTLHFASEFLVESRPEAPAWSGS